MRRFTPRTLLLAGIISAGVLPAQNPEARLKELGITLPTPSKPVANYVKAVQSGNLLFVAGHGTCGGGVQFTGKAGRDRTLEQAYENARQVGICMLATLKSELGDLRRVRRIVKVLGMVNATPEFADHPRVINGFSDLMVQVFGERGKHARSAVGMMSLPGGITVEVEMIVEVGPAR